MSPRNFNVRCKPSIRVQRMSPCAFCSAACTFAISSITGAARLTAMKARIKGRSSEKMMNDELKKTNSSLFILHLPPDEAGLGNFNTQQGAPGPVEHELRDQRLDP